MFSEYKDSILFVIETNALFLKYCSCVKTLKYKKDLQANLEYPFCMSSVYTKRGFKSPKGVTKRCKKYE